MFSANYLYRALTGAARAASPLLAFGDSKLAEGIRGRRHAAAALARWAGEHRDPERPLVWVHAPSVGEGLQARAVLEALLRLRPDLQVAYTYFSPSAASFPMDLPADVSAYLPWDVKSEVGAALDALCPQLLAFTKTEVWPVLTAEAARRGVPVALVAATLSENAGRLRRPARMVLRGAFSSLARVAACSDSDASRLGLLGVDRDRIIVTGDPGIDSALERSLERESSADHLPRLATGNRPVLVAGSTWEADEDVLLGAVGLLQEEGLALKVVLAPHEPRPDRIGRLKERITAAGWAAVTLGELSNGEGPDAEWVIVDRMGVLARLYRAGSVAFVGGGFGRRGLHSVLEPAACGIPVTFGPFYHSSSAAVDLIAVGAAEAVPSAESLARLLTEWVGRSGVGEAAGRRAAGYMAGHRGAAQRTAEALTPLLPPTGHG